MSNIVRIAELTEPLAHVDDYNETFKKVFCYVLFIEPPIRKGPKRIFITDFSSNLYVNNYVARDEILSQFGLMQEQIFQVDAYNERIKDFKLSYFNAKGKNLDLVEPMYDMKDLTDHGIIASITLRPKMFNRSLEGRASYIEVLSKDWIRKNLESIPMLEHLCKELIIRFPDSKKHILNDILPLYYFNSSNIDRNMPSIVNDRSGSRRNQIDSSQSFSTSQIQVENTFANQLGNDDDHGSGNRLFPVKDEVAGDLVPGNIFSDDMIDDNQRNYSSSNGNKYSNDGSNGSGNTIDDNRIASMIERTRMEKVQRQGSNVNLRNQVETTSIEFQESPKLFSIEDICKQKRVVDNVIYNIEAHVVDIIPTDLNHIIVKKYESINDKVELTDPIIRPIELLLSNDKSKFFNNANSLKIYMDCDQLLDLFAEPIELLYVKPEIITDKLNYLKSGKHPFKIYKKLVSIGDSSIIVWCCK